MIRLVAISLFLSAAAAQTEVVQTEMEGGGVYYDCAYSSPLQLDREVRLQHFKNSDLGTYTMRLSYTGGLGWVAIGINSDGRSKMVPSTAVIGRIEYDEDEITPIGSSVLKYDLLTEDEDGSGVVPMADELQTLMDATFEQSDDGTTSILTFTQKLDDVGNEAAGPITDESSWIYAIGLPDNQWEGSHEVQGSFYLPLEENCVKMSVKKPEVITDTEETDTTPVEEEPEEEVPHDTDPDESSVGNVDDAVQDPETEEQPTAAEPVEPVEPAIPYDCSFGEPHEMYGGKVKLEHFKNTAAGTYTMRLTYSGGNAWVSIGVNHEGSFHMAPSTCIIGRIEYDEDGITPIGSSVLKYDVTSSKEDASGVVVMADEFQTLMDTTFEQDGETSVLTFTQKLDDSGMNGPITDESSWIYAIGLPDNQWEGQHKVHGSFFMPLEDNCAVETAPGPAPAPASVEYDCAFVEPREVYGGKVKLEHFKNSAVGTYTMRLSYMGGDAWVSIGVNHEGSFHMAPSTCIIGRIEYDEDGITPIGSSVLKYDVTSSKEDASGVVAMTDEFQTLLNATFEQDGEKSVLTFTQKLDDSGMNGPITDESSWIYAIGLPDNQWEGQHKIHGSFFMPLEDNCVVANVGIPEASTGGSKSGGLVMRVDATKATFPLWVAHGWLMAIAWGLVGPLAIGSGILRRLVGSNWYKIHFYLNMMCVVMTIAGFILAVVAINMEAKPHFTRGDSQDEQEQVHHNAGLAIFIIVILQSVAGYFRPPVVPAPAAAAAPACVKNESDEKPTLCHSDTRKTEGDTIHGKVSFENEGNPKSTESQRLSPCNETSADLEGSQSTPERTNDADQQKPKSPWVRKMWEMQHRLTGAVVVGLAWYNCHSGYQLMEENYDESQDYTIVFWSVTGAIAGIIFILAYVARV
jgi:uncharacterized protein YihD (DUF1040 family)